MTPTVQPPGLRGHRRIRRSGTSGAALVVLLTLLPLLDGLAPRGLAADGARTLNVIPDAQESAANGPTSVTAEIDAPADAGPVEIDFEIYQGPNDDDGNTPASPDFRCSIPVGATSCNASYVGTAGGGTDRIRSWINVDGTNSFEGDPTETRDEVGEPGDVDEPDITDTVEVVWNATAAPVVRNLDCEPEQSPQQPASGTSAEQTFTCTVTSPPPPGSPGGTAGPPVEDVKIDGENLAGPNDPDNTNGFGTAASTVDHDDACTTGADGACVVHIVPAEGENGSAPICFWADYPTSDDVYNPAGISSDNGGDCDNETQGQDDQDRTDTVTARWLAITSLALSPATGAAATGAQQSVTATLHVSGSDATPVPGVPLIVSVTGANEIVDGATTDANGQAAFTYTGAHTGTDTVTAFADLNDNSVRDGFEPQATAARAWTPGDLVRIGCEPETASRPAAPLASSEQTFTCTVSDLFGNPVAAAIEIDAELAGPNDPDDGTEVGTADVDDLCTTSASTGSCSGSVSATETQAGTATVCLFTDTNANDAFDPAGAAADGGECLTEEPADADDNLTDVVTLTWDPGPADRVDCSPDDAASPPTGAGSDAVYTCAVRDAHDNLVGAGTRIDAENLGGANDPDHSAGKGSGGSSNTTPDWDNVCTTGADGTCSATLPVAGETGTALICFWIDKPSSVDARYNISGAEADGGACDNDPAPPAADDLGATDLVRRSWQERALSAVTLSPAGGTSPIGVGHTVTATVADQFGGGIARVTVRFSVSGTTVRSSSAVTSASGTATLTYGSVRTGTDSIDAYADVNTNGTRDEGEPAGAATSTWVEPTAAGGYWLVADDGGIFSYGSARFHGSTGSVKLARPIVGMASTPSGEGYWLVASDGGIFSFGDAGFYGSTGSVKLARPIVGMASTASGRGYWLVAADGGIFAFGDAHFHGSTGSIKLARPIVAMVPTSGEGYWLVASDGGIFSFGDAGFHGSTVNLKLAKPIVGMARTATSAGYWLLASDGGIFAFGDATFHGSVGNLKLARPIVAITSTGTGQGYWLVASDGGIFSFGDARFHGSTGNLRLARPIVGIASRR